MLEHAAEGVLVHVSEFCLSNAVVVDGAEGALLIDAGILDEELTCLARDLEDIGADRRRRVLHPSALGPPALA